MLFLEPEENANLRFVTVRQVEISLRENDHILLMFASLRMENDVMVSDVTISDMSTVCEFPDVFPKDICELPPEHEVEFAIDLVPGTRLVSMDLYHMSASELRELKK